MGLFNKKDGSGKTGFANFLKKAAGIFPEVIAIGGKLATGNLAGAFTDVSDLLKSKASTDAQAAELLQEFEKYKMEWQLEAFNSEVEDRKSARNVYLQDNSIQKIFAILFLVAYIALSYYLINILTGSVEFNSLAENLIIMIFTGTSMKLNTIIDFFFGGSV